MYVCYYKTIEKICLLSISLSLLEINPLSVISGPCQVQFSIMRIAITYLIIIFWQNYETIRFYLRRLYLKRFYLNRFAASYQKDLSCFNVSNINWYNTPGTRGGPGVHDQTLALKRRKNDRKSAFFIKK